MWHILSFILGAVVGSFLNVVIYRLPREGLSIWYPPRSFCPNCGHTLSWKDNIPIVSYLILRGRCRYCGWRIPVRYLLVETFNSAFYGLTSFVIRDPIIAVGLWGVFSTLLAIAYIDLETMTIHDSLNLSVFLFSLLMALRTGALIRGLITGAVVFGIFFLVSRFGGFGTGDALLIGGASVSMDPLAISWTILIGSASALVYSVIKFKGFRLREKVPFGPFLAIGVIFGDVYTLWTRGALGWHASF